MGTAIGKWYEEDVQAAEAPQPESENITEVKETPQQRRRRNKEE